MDKCGTDMGVRLGMGRSDLKGDNYGQEWNLADGQIWQGVVRYGRG